MLKLNQDAIPNRPKSIDEDYQAQIDAFIEKNGVTYLSDTDNKIDKGWTKQCEGSSYQKKVSNGKDRFEESTLDKFKDALRTGEVVSDFESLGFSSKRTVASYVGYMRKSGWEIETVFGVGYRLIKAGGFVWLDNKRRRRYEP